MGMTSQADPVLPDYTGGCTSNVVPELVKQLGNTKRLAKQKGDVYILNHSPVPTALVEVGFLSNPAEAELLSKPEYQKKVAASIYLGILQYYTGKEPPPIVDQ